MYIPTAQLTLAGQWTPYVPTWTGSITDPVIGNGSILGAYLQVGQLVIAKASIMMGSTTTFGLGNYNISLPVTEEISRGISVGPGMALDSSLNQTFICHWRDAFVLINTSPVGLLAPTIPFIFAQDDQIQLTIIYKTT